jgi:hypothetical protein
MGAKVKKMRFRRFRPDPRRALKPEPRQDRNPSLAKAECPRCHHRFETMYRYCFAQCKCGWMLSVEPAPRYGRTDRYWPVTIDALKQVAPSGWEEAKEWPGIGDEITLRCKVCGGPRPMTQRLKEAGAIIVMTCNTCGTAYPDAAATRSAISAKIQDWVRTGKATVHHGADGKPIGIKLPSHEDVMDEADLRKMQQAEQDGSKG